MRYRLIEAEKAEHAISRLCKVLGVMRQASTPGGDAGRVCGNWAMPS
jgi:hypothetical protein